MLQGMLKASGETRLSILKIGKVIHQPMVEKDQVGVKNDKRMAPN